MAGPIPIHRKLLYTGAVFVLFLLCVEGLLALAPGLYRRTHVLSGPLGEGEGAGPALSASGVVLAVGDSVTAGVGAPPGQSWPDHLSLSLRKAGRALEREASPGAGIAFAQAAPLDRVEAMPADAAPVVLVMLGHNDVLRWAPGARHGFEQLRRDEAAAERYSSTGGEAARWRGPRLLRALGWAWLAARRARPDVVLPDDLVERMVSAYRPLRDSAAVRGGQLVLLTYLVPGAPPPGLDEDLAAVISASSEAQRGVNAAIREAAAALAVATVDVERAVPVPEQWTLDMFADHIHLSARGAARVAARISRQLLEGPGATGSG